MIAPRIRLSRPQARGSARAGRYPLRLLALCALPVAVLFAVVALAPLPFSVARPGVTADVLGRHDGAEVIAVSGAPVRRTSGELRMTAIAVPGPDAVPRLRDVAGGWFREDRAVLPREAVYPRGESDRETAEHNAADMRKSQHTATSAALAQAKADPDRVRVRLRLADVGGPSAGLLFALGIVDKLDGDGRGGDLTGGRSIAGTGTIDASGKVGPVSGAPLKAKAARRDGASVFLAPKTQCADVRAGAPAGLRVIRVGTLADAVSALRALDGGGRVPGC